MLPPSLQASMSQIRYFYRIIILDTLRPGVLASEAPQKAQLPSQAHVPTLTQDPAVTEMLQWNDAHQDADSKAVCPRPMSWVLYSESVDDGKAIRGSSGINWKFARQGPAVAEEDVTFERKAFIDGVTYLLKALPPDLDVCELRRIQSALPEDVAHLDQVAVQKGDGLTQSASGRPRSILHRSVQMTVANLIFVLSFMLPYLMYLIRHIARMERKYKVFETVVGHGLSFVNSIGKQSLSLTETMCQMNDGKVGQALLEAFLWTVDGVARGISEGLGEGLQLYCSSHFH
ncbi:hypothetical protein FOXG_07319 [Fusarium oxysporum f. sp. lycopersici 4287]|uniref:Uncharacterized protein n=1 Tax=Fusarium oxysporum f. sp. lycopersici (strain 4287 / CBS 123668 / FGSC 9935 / NRRL 34936) TaxID=426428 RepID=A0A0J9V715_FUSO4|nr:hypothetical protein FOXG_07319 [Fusarium oxysporum f. sp. lycopersici 4287]KNB06646.1 hypothetical protein FOXG_07319 [Fusarium oxysporum f. sp. lycopersici 4287]